MSETPTVVKRPDWDNETLVAKFIALRDKKAEIVERHKKELEPYGKAMEQLELWMLQDLQAQKADSVKTAAGTFYKAKKTSVTTNRWSQTLEWILENERTELLEARVNKTMYLELQKELAEKFKAAQEAGENPDPSTLEVPGVVVHTELTVGVRRA
jgi:hypothetical protein